MTTREFSTWAKAHGRLTPEVWPHVEREILAQKGDTVFTMGSCFARNIELHLERLGIHIPVIGFRVPPEEYPNISNIGDSSCGMLNNYSPAGIFQEFDLLARVYDRDGVVTVDDILSLAYPFKNGLYADLQLRGYAPVTLERLVNRRQEIFDIYKSTFDSKVIVITLGLIEVWFDKIRKIYIQESPHNSSEMRANLKHFKFKVLSFKESYSLIQKSMKIILDRNPNATILITTSPVSLARTFTSQDVIVANMHSKSTLRAVCGELASKNKHVRYFPSFESVVLTKSWDVWNEDMLHVNSDFVGKIVSKLLSVYFVVEEADHLNLEAGLVKSEEGIKLLRKALEITESPKYYYNLGRIYGQLNDFQNAKLAFQEAVKLDSQFADAHSELAMMYVKEKKYQEAIESIHKAIEYQKHEERNYQKLIHIYNLAGVPNSKKKVWQLARDNCPKDPYFTSQLAQHCSVREAIELLNTYLNSYPGNDDHRIYNVLSHSYAQLRELDLAIKFSELAIKHNNEYFPYQIYLGVLYFSKGENLKAKDSLLKVISQYPKASNAFYHLSRILLSENNPNQALNYIQKALEIKEDASYITLSADIIKALKQDKEAQVSKSIQESAPNKNDTQIS